MENSFSQGRKRLLIRTATIKIATATALTDNHSSPAPISRDNYNATGVSVAQEHSAHETHEAHIFISHSSGWHPGLNHPVLQTGKATGWGPCAMVCSFSAPVPSNFISPLWS